MTINIALEYLARAIIVDIICFDPESEVTYVGLN